MPSLHWASHAMALGVITWLLRQNLQLRYHCHLQELPPPPCSCPPPPPAGQGPADEQEGAGVPRSQERNTTGLSTSISCWGEARASRSCHFRNLCYRPSSGDFVVFHGNHSYFENVPWNDGNAWLDMASVANHNTHHFLPVDLPGKTVDQFSISWVQEPSLILKRFKPDNIMHVLHDDVLPIFHTARMTFSREGRSCGYNASLVFVDEWEEELEYDWLYESLSVHEVINRQSLKDRGEMVCFSDAVVGVSKSTTWYQYGFNVPQGPLPEITVTSSDIRAATSFILDRISYPCCVCREGDYVVILSRQQTRLILNEAELAQGLARATGFRVLSLSLDLHSMQSILQTVHCARGVVGMHGSLMITAMFLRPGSFIIELFPYAVPPENYTPYKTLAQIPGMNLTYRAWANPDQSKSVAHPDWTEEQGGIEHLSPEDQEAIKSQTLVPKHLCCKDPSWLYHAYQDTVVDVAAITSLVGESVEESRTFQHPLDRDVSTGPRPGKVENLNCRPWQDSKGRPRLLVSWSAPWNLHHLQYSECHFEIWLQDKSLPEDFLSVIVPSCDATDVQLEQVKSGREYYVWVRVVLSENSTGGFQGVYDCRV